MTWDKKGICKVLDVPGALKSIKTKSSTSPSSDNYLLQTIPMPPAGLDMSEDFLAADDFQIVYATNEIDDRYLRVYTRTFLGVD